MSDDVGQVLAFMSTSQVGFIRSFLDSPENDTWVRSADVDDNAIREAVAAVGMSAGAVLPKVAAYLAARHSP